MSDSKTLKAELVDQLSLCGGMPPHEKLYLISQPCSSLQLPFICY